MSQAPTQPRVRRSSRLPASSRPTITQVAALAGYSVSTVSAVLNARSYCWASAETKQRIFRAAGSLGYRPNLAARSLRGASTQTIGLLTVALDVEVSAMKVQAFERAARGAGYTTMITYNPNDPGTEDRLLEKLRDRSMDGVAVYPAEQGPHAELRKMVAEGFPLVTWDGAGRVDLECDDVSTDYLEAGRLQVRHLVERGRRRLVHANTYPSCCVKDRLRAGAREAAAEAGASLELLDMDLDAHSGSRMCADLVRQVRDFLSRSRGEIDGFIGYDLLGAAAVRAALELGIRVPDELAVVGFDNSPTAANCVIPLATVEQNADQIGATLFGLLRERIEKGAEAGPLRRVAVKPVMVEGASS